MCTQWVPIMLTMLIHKTVIVTLWPSEYSLSKNAIWLLLYRAKSNLAYIPDINF